jgi:hypothetical protein
MNTVTQTFFGAHYCSPFSPSNTCYVFSWVPCTGMYIKILFRTISSNIAHTRGFIYYSYRTYNVSTYLTHEIFVCCCFRSTWNLRLSLLPKNMKSSVIERISYGIQKNKSVTNKQSKLLQPLLYIIRKSAHVTIQCY